MTTIRVLVVEPIDPDGVSVTSVRQYDSEGVFHPRISRRYAEGNITISDVRKGMRLMTVEVAFNLIEKISGHGFHVI